MNLLHNIENQPELRAYWEKLLGSELVDKVIKSPDIINLEPLYDVSKVDDELRAFTEYLYSVDNSVEENIAESKGMFDSFFGYITAYVEASLSKHMNGSVDKDILMYLSKQITERLSWTCVRCLISEMHFLDEKDKLQGKDNTEKYQDYLERYLKEPDYVSSFLQKYPVIAELIVIKSKDYVQYIHELLTHLEGDKDEIIVKLCDGKPFGKIKDMKLHLSDEHVSGKTVARLTLDNDYVIYYKPHDISLADCYDKIYRWLLEKCGLDSFDYRMLDKKTYGWESEVTHQACNNCQEVELFYRRTGIQTCLTYILGVTDVHYENMISHGQYPVIIDLEFFGDRRLSVSDNPNSINDMLKDTVLNTGMLPVNVWAGHEINMGGLGELSEQRAPVKMPVIKKAGRSDMAIDYEYPRINAVKSLPELNGDRIDFKAYIPYIIRGFKEAYLIVLNNKEEFLAKFGDILPNRSRFIMRNTQEYFMYQNSLNFVELMRNKENRQLMLIHMAKGLRCEQSYQRDILKYEMTCIYYSVIPVFYAEGKDLCLGNGQRLENYFQMDGKTQIICRLNKLSPRDLGFQIKVIETDFLSYAKTDTAWHGRLYSDTANILELSATNIADIILEDMFDFNKDFGWIDVKYSRSGRTYPGPVDLYLYNGLCGMSLFFAGLSRHYKEKKYICAFHRIVEKLFTHTDQLSNNSQKHKGCRWGLFTGEASLIYTYLKLYKITGNAAYITYAKRHGYILIAHAGDVHENDLLEGKAGILLALMMLYEATGDEQYLNSSRYTALLLIEDAVELNGGIGWTNTGNKPLAGMAHGNSGIALPLAYLWKYTKDDYYMECIKKALHYEDSLYNAEFCNWMDIRKQDDNGHSGADTVAWCHGAAGILAARMAIHRLTDLSFETLLGGIIPDECDQSTGIEKIITKIKTARKLDMCLCHGNVGLIEIVNEWRILNGFEADESIKERCRKNDVKQLSFEDRNNPGFMTGLAGLGYTMLREIDRTLPEILYLI